MKKSEVKSQKSEAKRSKIQKPKSKIAGPRGERIEIYRNKRSGQWYVRWVARNGLKDWMSCQPQRLSDAWKKAGRLNAKLRSPLPVYVVEKP